MSDGVNRHSKSSPVGLTGIFLELTMSIKNLVFAACLGLAAATASAGTVTWTFDIQIPTSNLGNGASPQPAAFPCRSAIGTVTYVESATRSHNVGQLLDADISICGTNYTEANLFGNDNFVGTRDPANSFNTNAFGFSIAFYEQLGTTFAELFGTALNGRNLWQQIGLGTYTRVGAPPSAAVPVPASAALFGLGLLGFAALRKKK